MLDTGEEQQRLESRPREGQLNEVIRNLVGGFEQEALRRVGLRSGVEQRWIEDLRQFHGMYDSKKLKQMEDNKQSQIFINLTGPKTEAFSAKLMDLLFPTEDRNWGIRPSPVPEMDRMEEKLQGRKQKAEGALAEAQARAEDPSQTDAMALQTADQEAEVAKEEVATAQAALDELNELKAEAKRRADLMQEEMDDQLKATSYQAECRDMIEDACKLGTGVMYGPVLSEKQYLRWKKRDNGFELTNAMDMRPGYKRRDPWGFFPDPDARSVDENEGFYYRHLMTKKALRKMARRPGVDKDAVREILRSEPENVAPQGMASLYSLTGDSSHQIEGKYVVWEYIGPIEAEKLQTILHAYQDEALLEEMFGDEEIDPLTEIHARIEFCQGEVLSFALHPMESNEAVYTVFNIKRAEVGLFGFGIPFLMRDPQSSFNAAWRAMMDNGALSVAPIIVINKDVVKPQDNDQDYSLKGGKIFIRVTGEENVPAVETYDIPINQALLGNIIEMSRLMIDETTSMPQIAQGEQASHVTKTSSGMAMLMNATNTVFRRVVRNFDDDVTIPNIRRLYDFNMQFSRKEEIKGDYEPVAMGSSVLLVREMQSENLMNIATQFGEHPEYGIWLDKPSLLREILKANMVQTEGILKTETQVKDEMRKARSEENPELQIRAEELNLKKEEIAAKVEIAKVQADSRIQAAEFAYRGRMEQIAAALNMKVEDVEAKMEAEEMRQNAGERRLAAEIAMRKETGVSAGGSV